MKTRDEDKALASKKVTVAGETYKYLAERASSYVVVRWFLTQSDAVSVFRDASGQLIGLQLYVAGETTQTVSYAPFLTSEASVLIQCDVHFSAGNVKASALLARWLVRPLVVSSSRLLVALDDKYGVAVALFAGPGTVRLRGCVLDVGVLVDAEQVIAEQVGGR